MYSFLKGRLIPIRLIMIAAVLILIAVGIATIYSVGHPADTDPSDANSVLAGLWKKQLIFAVIAAAGFIIANLLNYRKLGTLSYWIYASVLLLLAIVLTGKFINIPFIPMINGSHRWIRFSIAGHNLPAIQPSEFCKLAYVLALAWYLRYKSNYQNIKALIGPFILTLLPMALHYFGTKWRPGTSPIHPRLDQRSPANAASNRRVARPDQPDLIASATKD